MFADEGKGVHTWYYVGTSFTAPWDEPGWIEGSCGKLVVRPSVAHTPLGVKQGLCGIIRYVPHALKERSDSHIPRLASSREWYEPEDDYVGQLPRPVAAPLGHGVLNPTVGGASADTRLADTAAFTPDPVALVPPDPTAKADTGASPAYPSDSKERENERRRRLKEEGKEIVAKKKKVHVEDHHGDCGEYLSSLAGATLIDGDGSDCTSAAESDAAHDEDLRAEIGVRAYPIDVSKVARA